MSLFYSVDNYKECLDAFQRYLGTRGVEEPPDLKKRLYEKIVEFKDRASTANMSVKDMNNSVLNALRNEVGQTRVPMAEKQQPKQHFMQQQQQQQQQQRPPTVAPPPRHSILDQNMDVFADRPMPTEHMKPIATSSGKASEEDYDRLMQERNSIEPVNAPPPKMVEEFETFRSRHMTETAEIREVEQALSPSEFASSLFTAPKRGSGPSDLLDSSAAHGSSYLLNQQGSLTNLQETGGHASFFSAAAANDDVAAETHVIQPPSITSTLRNIAQLDNYVSVNGFDRDWVVHKHRYSYTLSLGTRFRNVREIQATCLVIPMEIYEKKTMSMLPKTNFVHDYGLMYPYLLLTLNEATDVYAGTNSAVRRAFAKFVYDSSYRSPNGRGYMILRPMQRESKIFRPAPLASLTSMTLSIQKPNGTLYNNSIDDFGVHKVEHEAWNRMYLKVVLDKYFDRNEFYIGDSIIIKEFELKIESKKEYRGEDDDDAAVDDPVPYACINGLRRLCEFMNRAEGHEIVEIGKGNSQGFHNNFYVLAPGVLDQIEGKVEVDADAIAGLKAYNLREFKQQEGACCEEAAGEEGCSDESMVDKKAPPAFSQVRGHVINASLQNVASFKVVTYEGDDTVLNVSLIGAGGG